VHPPLPGDFMNAPPALGARASGPALFARFAYPPNALGYCGPDDAQAVLEYAAAQTSDRGLVDLARQFHGAWPYLQLIAAAAGISDPLDSHVVRSYWTGGPLLERVPPAMLAAHLEERFRHQVGRHWSDLAKLAAAGGRPHHNFHVFGVYPWAGMLRGGTVAEPLRVLDRCRIRWGRLTALSGRMAVVQTRPVCWDGHRLSLGLIREEQAQVGSDGRSLAAGLAVGAMVALHWDWVCEVLDPPRLDWLRYYTRTQLAVVNAALADSAPAPALR
jgi:hypothetical protein